MRRRQLQAPRAAQQGVIAILFAVLIVALATLFAVNLAWDNTLDARRSASLYWREQAVQVALGAETWIGSILKLDASETETDHLDEIWATELPPLPVEGAGLVGDVSGALTDAQGLFNVNNLLDGTGTVDPIVLAQLERLLVALDIDPKFAGITADWLDADSAPQFPSGAEDNAYTGLTPPYRAANQPISDVSELAALFEMEPEVFQKLRPFITALPGLTRLNVNTAPAPVLQSLDERIDASVAEGLLEQRADGGFADIGNAFQNLIEPDRLPQLAENSDYFKLRAVVRIGSVRITMYSLFYRDASGTVSSILRSFANG